MRGPTRSVNAMQTAQHEVNATRLHSQEANMRGRGWGTFRNEVPHPDAAAAAAGFADSLPSLASSEPDLSSPSPLLANTELGFPVASVEAKAASLPSENIAGTPVSTVDVLAASVPALTPNLLAGIVAGLAAGLNRDDCGAGV